MVADPPLIAGSHHAQWQTDQHAKQNGQRCQLDGGREHPLDVIEYRVAGEQCIAEITVQQVVQVQPELGPDRFVQAHRPVYLVVGGAVGIRANYRQHRVQRHDPADEERQRQQAKQGHQHRAGPAGGTRYTGTHYRGSRSKHNRLLKKQSPITQA
ncbi:hypothetical protein D9M71_268700 [compost metagenome]